MDEQEKKTPTPEGTAPSETITPQIESEKEENPAKSPSKSFWDPKSKKAIILFGSVGVLLVAAMTALLVVGSRLAKQTGNQYENLGGTTAGFYDASGKYVDEGGVINADLIGQDNPYYSLTLIDIKKDGISTFLLPYAYRASRSATAYYVYATSDCASDRNLFGQSDKDDALTTIAAEHYYTSLGAYTFANMKALKKVAFANSTSATTAFGSGCFMNDALLEEVALPLSTSEIGASCFENCTSLSSLSLPNKSLSRIGNKAFKGCSSLKSLAYSGSKEEFQTLVSGVSDWHETSLTGVVCSNGTLTL